MPFTWRINITKNPVPSKPAIFTFDQPPQVEVGDQVFWANEDTVAHWPALSPPTGANVTHFMAFQIAPRSTSPAFAPAAVGTITYVCSLHPGESGTINVVSPPAPIKPKTT